MRIKKDFEIQDICGEKVVTAQGVQHVDFGKIISLNETSADLWIHFQGKEFNETDLTTYLCQEYNVLPQIAQEDIKNWIADMQKHGLVEI